MSPVTLALIGISLSFVAAAAAAAFGIIAGGKAMAGAGTERPEILTKAIITIVLAEAIAIYGLLCAFMLLGRLGAIVTIDAGYKALTAGAVIAAASMAAGFGIAHCGSAMTSAMVERPETFSKNVIGIVLAEAIAIYGLLVSFMIIGQI